MEETSELTEQLESISCAVSKNEKVDTGLFQTMKGKVCPRSGKKSDYFLDLCLSLAKIRNENMDSNKQEHSSVVKLKEKEELLAKNIKEITSSNQKAELKRKEILLGQMLFSIEEMIIDTVTDKRANSRYTLKEMISGLRKSDSTMFDEITVAKRRWNDLKKNLRFWKNGDEKVIQHLKAYRVPIVHPRPQSLTDLKEAIDQVSKQNPGDKKDLDSFFQIYQKSASII